MIMMMLLPKSTHGRVDAHHFLHLRVRVIRAVRVRPHAAVFEVDEAVRSEVRHDRHTRRGPAKVWALELRRPPQDRVFVVIVRALV